MNMTKNILLTFLLLNASVFSHLSIAAENDANQNSNPSSQTSKKIPFSTSLTKLEKNHSADDAFWINLDNQKTLVLNYSAKGKKRRGNVILLHSQGENADHPRLVFPLSKQLSALGWNVYIPNLPKEDFAVVAEVKKPTSEKVTTKNSNKLEKDLPKPDLQHKRYFFSNEQAYQQIFSKILSEVINKIPQTEDNLLIISSQNTSYWVLDKLKTDPTINFAAFLMPEIPQGIKVDLKTLFESQKTPLYVFFPENQFSLEISNAFNQKFWRGDDIRINRILISQQGIILEDNQISKLISGWIQSKKQ